MASEASAPTEQTEDGTEMSLLDHLRELRNRLTVCAIAMALGSAAGFWLKDFALDQIQVLLNGSKIIAISPFEGLAGVFNIALTIGVSLALPVILYEVMAFVMPGLMPKERHWLRIGFPATIFMFLLGSGFAWFFFLPSALKLLTDINKGQIDYQIRIEEIIPFITGILFWMGVSFELPIVMFLLAKLNVVNAHLMVKYWRHAMILIAILAAFITPTPDPMNMGLVMAPLLVLYGISIGLVWLARRGATVPAMLDPNEKTASETNDVIGP